MPPTPGEGTSASSASSPPRDAASASFWRYDNLLDRPTVEGLADIYHRTMYPLSVDTVGCELTADGPLSTGRAWRRTSVRGATAPTGAFSSSLSQCAQWPPASSRTAACPATYQLRYKRARVRWRKSATQQQWPRCSAIPTPSSRPTPCHCSRHARSSAAPACSVGTALPRWHTTAPTRSSQRKPASTTRPTGRPA